MKKINLLVIAIVLFLSCQDAKDKAIESVTNSVIEKSLDQVGVTSENIERANQNIAEVSFTFDGEQLFTKEENFKTIINAAGKQMLVFTFNSDNAKINIIFSSLQNMLNKKPIHGIYKEGKSDPKDANGTVVSITAAKDNSFAYMLFDGAATVNSFTKDEVVIEFSGKAGKFIDANTPTNWKSIQGKITSKYPVISMIQVTEEELIY